VELGSYVRVARCFPASCLRSTLQQPPHTESTNEVRQFGELTFDLDSFRSVGLVSFRRVVDRRVGVEEGLGGVGERTEIVGRGTREGE
jgi:hypothetical protein